ncbi:vanadium-dependent haloperoxidase [Pyxidicoccus fallax]|uniref:vanadium-dependent haloperoxidase n=1 Tax=Pyxidicoccus fallax TaxID=394095 RepID=UPI001FE400E1|nr:vanadium-dependent haloperoxidase [Pyxidicoccus fallax]
MAKASTLIDNFNDNFIDTTKWSTYGIGVAEVNQRVEIRPEANVAQSYEGYQSAVPYDLSNSAAQVEVVQTLRALPGAFVFFEVGPDDNNRVIFNLSEELHCVQAVSGNFTTLLSIPYDPLLHRWLRFRDSEGTVYWETSPDGAHWTVQAQNDRAIDVFSARIGFGTGLQQAVPSPGVAIFDSLNVPTTSLSRRVEERRQSAQGTREKAAALAARRPHPEHLNNNDETNYPDRPFIGNYSKSLRHDSLGDPDPLSYGTLLRALHSRDPGDFEEILLAPNAKKLTNPQSGLAFELAGPDAQAVTQPPAPRFDSAQTAAEMGELYWMALARDVPFINYATEAATSGSIIARAIGSLSSEFPTFGGTAPVTAQNLFRGIYVGEQVGPYVSQFLLKGNIDPRQPDGQGRDAAEGFVAFGSRVIDQRQRTVKGFAELGAAADYLTTFSNWLAVQNGRDDRGQDQLDLTARRFIRNLRDGANFVHFDQVVDAWWNVAYYLFSEPRGNQSLGNASGTGRPLVDLEFSFNPGHPYDPPGTTGDSRTQVGFTTFGTVHLLQALLEVSGRAGRAVWWQKWGVHRRLRPEEFGGRVDNQLNNRRTYPIHASLTTSLSTGGLAPYFPERYGSYLLPQAYPEGAPTHPAYGAGHATISGACATLLKAFFDENQLIEAPVLPSADGLSLVAYTGPGALQLTVGGELNKLAGNIALFRDAAGVHWRSDYTESLPLGEAVAIGLLQEMSLTLNEDDAFFQLTKFDGTRIRIHDGRVQTVIE